MRERRSATGVEGGYHERRIRQIISAVPIVVATAWFLVHGREVSAATETWVRCATEGGLCAFTGTQRVRFGLAPDRYASRTLAARNGGASCTTRVFGDPAYGQLKYCDVLVISDSTPTNPPAPPASAPPASWTRVASEGSSFNITGSAAVRYGAGSAWVERTVSGMGSCSNEYFGIDPLYGVVKACYAAPTGVRVGPPPAGWVRIAAEGGSFTLSSTRAVRYGAGTGNTWIERTLSGSGSCTNTFFGADPNVGATKACWSAPTPSVPPTQPPPTSGGDYHPVGYSLVFQDEFTGTSLDYGKWCTRYIYAGGPALQVPDPQCQRNGAGTLDFLNDEQQRYRDRNTQNETLHVVSNGVLALRATKTRSDSWASYESAMIRSKATFVPTSTVSYYLTTRVKLPNVRGTWPAFWLAASYSASNALDWPPEIDIFEGALNGREDREDMLRQGAQIRGGRQTTTGQQMITYSAPEYERTWNNYYAPESLREVWIEVGAEWTAQGVCYYVDGYRTMCENYRWVNDSGSATGPATLLLNLAIGGGWAGRYGVDDTRFPTRLEIDYVRVYAKSN